MGGKHTKFKTVSSRNRRHDWGRVQNLEPYTEEYKEDDSDSVYSSDGEYELDKVDWPRSCPVLHLNIKEDFELNEHRTLMNSMYRFWIFQFWCTIINFVAVMSAQLISFITNGNQVVVAFFLIVISLFGVFFLYFRTLYWALRTGSNVLYFFFYFFSIAMFSFFAYSIVTALSWMATLAAPLQPNSPLPVKANPIFPMIAFTLVIFFYLICVVFSIHYCSRAFKYQFMTEEEYEALLRKQRKKGWLKKFFKNDDVDDNDENGYRFPCIVQYDQMDAEGVKISKKNAKGKKGKAKAKGAEEAESLSVTGTLLVEPTKYFVTFRADEAVFTYVFSMKIWLRNVTAVKKKGKDVIQIIEKQNSQTPDVEKNQYELQPPSCLTEAMIVRKIQLDFRNNNDRDDCYKRLQKAWKVALKAKSDPEGELRLENLRLGLIRRNKERAQKHLLTHKHWKKILECVWRVNVPAGKAIIDIGVHYDSLMHIGEGQVDVFLETSAATETGDSVDLANHDDFDEILPEEILFPGINRQPQQEQDVCLGPLTPARILEARKENMPLKFTVSFEKRERPYFQYDVRSLRSTDVQSENQTRTAAVVIGVRKDSQAAKGYVEKGDEIAMIDAFDIEKNINLLERNGRLTKAGHAELTSRIDQALTFPNPLTITFSRAASNKWVDQKSTKLSDIASLLPTHKDNLNETSDDDAEDDEHIEVVVLGGGEENLGGGVGEGVEMQTISNPLAARIAPSSSMGGTSGMFELDMAEEQATRVYSQVASEADETVEFIAPNASFELEDTQPQKETGRFKGFLRRGKNEPSDVLKSDEYAPIGTGDDNDSDGEAGQDKKLPEDIPVEKKSILQKTRLMLFGHPFKGDRSDVQVDGVDDVTEYSYRYLSSAGDTHRIGEIDVKKSEGVFDDEDAFTSSTTSDFSNVLANAQSFEFVGKLEKGDTIGIIPWVLNHPVSVVQLSASTNVVLHTIAIKDLESVLRKDASLAIAFFKYIAAVLGERADRDEEMLCDQIAKADANRNGNGAGMNGQLCRLLDNKPIKVTTDTNFSEMAEEMKHIRRYFETDFDMDFDSVVDTFPGCRAQLVGVVGLTKGKKQWSGYNKDSQEREVREGTLYITLHYICFSSNKKTLVEFHRRPRFYGKIHLNDVYEIRKNELEQSLLIVTDNCRFEVFLKSGCDYVYDLIRTMSENTAVERAPQSYTLPGHQDVKLPFSGETDDDILESLWKNQRGLRADLLALVKTMQTVLTKEDKFKLFRAGHSVTLKKNQNVLTASADTKNIRKDTDDPKGLYLLGKGELVVQREVHGRRIQFASYQALDIFGIERFLTDAPSPCSIKVSSDMATLKFASYDRCMAILRSDPVLASKFYQYCALSFMKRLRGPILSRPTNEYDEAKIQHELPQGEKGCVIL